MTDTSPTSQDQERRRFYRIQDEIGIKLTPIAAADEQAAIDAFENDSRCAGLLNELRGMRYQHLPQQRSLENKFPTVAAYVRTLERQIDMLALAIDGRDDFPTAASHLANISAQGISLTIDGSYPIGSLVDVKMTLFPGPCRVEALGRVVRNDANSPSGEVALDFSHLRDADREALIRHVYMLQRHQLQARMPDD
ncbi:PilZ domain-containing protein [Imhoffiella purpurea]|uniref:PilZ domain-containing protein n=1 Tax=Imhoffiella purpurea TaxID=1249627 RepID=W9VBD1_9GAMM|nr:PilZ domain-containing protein [Imhoffiella purpurea]EXJ16754.1 hypothetical protein D779_3431 [Imhoffiella purpurea]